MHDTHLSSNAAIAKYCLEWKDSFVVIGLRKPALEEMDEFHTNWPLAEPGILMDEEYLKRRDAAVRKLRNVNQNLSRDFSTIEEAREWMIECAQHGATYLMLLDPQTYNWSIDTLFKHPDTKLLHMRIVAQHIQWLMGEDA